MHSLPLIGWRSSDARLHYLYASVTEFTLNPYLHTTNTKNFFFPPSQPPNEFKPTNILTEPNTVFEPWSISPTTDSWTICMTPPSPLTRNNTNHHQPPSPTPLHHRILESQCEENRNARGKEPQGERPHDPDSAAVPDDKTSVMDQTGGASLISDEGCSKRHAIMPSKESTWRTLNSNTTKQ